MTNHNQDKIKTYLTNGRYDPYKSQDIEYQNKEAQRNSEKEKAKQLKKITESFSFLTRVEKLLKKLPEEDLLLGDPRIVRRIKKLTPKELYYRLPAPKKPHHIHTQSHTLWQLPSVQTHSHAEVNDVRHVTSHHSNEILVNIVEQLED